MKNLIFLLLIFQIFTHQKFGNFQFRIKVQSMIQHSLVKFIIKSQRLNSSIKKRSLFYFY